MHPEVVKRYDQLSESAAKVPGATGVLYADHPVGGVRRAWAENPAVSIDDVLRRLGIERDTSVIERLLARADIPAEVLFDLVRRRPTNAREAIGHPNATADVIRLGVAGHRRSPAAVAELLRGPARVLCTADELEEMGCQVLDGVTKHAELAAAAAAHVPTPKLDTWFATHAELPAALGVAVVLADRLMATGATIRGTLRQVLLDTSGGSMYLGGLIGSRVHAQGPLWDIVARHGTNPKVLLHLTRSPSSWRYNAFVWTNPAATVETLTGNGNIAPYTRGTLFGTWATNVRRARPEDLVLRLSAAGPAVRAEDQTKAVRTLGTADDVAAVAATVAADSSWMTELAEHPEADARVRRACPLMRMGPTCADWFLRELANSPNTDAAQALVDKNPRAVAGDLIDLLESL